MTSTRLYRLCPSSSPTRRRVVATHNIMSSGKQNQHSAHACVPGPHVDAGHLEPVVPRSRVRSLSLGAGAHAVPVRLAVLPSAAVRAAVVEVEPAAVDQYLVGGGRPGGRRRRRRVAGQLLLVLLQQHLLLLLLLQLLLLLLRYAVPVGRCRRGRRRHAAARLHDGRYALLAGRLPENTRKPLVTSSIVAAVTVAVSVTTPQPPPPPPHPPPPGQPNLLRRGPVTVVRVVFRVSPIPRLCRPPVVVPATRLIIILY